MLKTFYHAGEQRGEFGSGLDRDAVLAIRTFPAVILSWSLWNLRRRGLLTKKDSRYSLTEKGKVQGARLARIHRLWELYLTRYLRIAADHVHDDAEAMEHLITPEIEAQLEAALDYPERDPHNRDIPR